MGKKVSTKDISISVQGYFGSCFEMSESQTTVRWGYQVKKRCQCWQVRVQTKKQSNFLFYCDLELVGVVMNMIHICIVSLCSVQDANINSTHDWSTVLFFFHAPVAAVILTVLIFATYTSSKVFLNYAIYTFICSCILFEVTVGIRYWCLMKFLQFKTPIPSPCGRQLHPEFFGLFICSFYIPLPPIPTMTIMNEITSSFILVSLWHEREYSVT